MPVCAPELRLRPDMPTLKEVSPFSRAFNGRMSILVVSTNSCEQFLSAMLRSHTDWKCLKLSST